MLVIKFSFLVLISATLYSKPSYPKGEVSLVTGEWCPYLSSEFDFQGVFARIVTKAFELEGYRAQISFKPWARAYNDVKRGIHDGSIGWARTDKRKKLFYFSDDVLEQEQMIFHHKATLFDWSEMNDLKPYVLGLTRSFAYTKALQEMIDKGLIKAEISSSDEQNMKRLVLKRIDLFPVAKEVGICLIREKLSKEQRKKIVFHNKPLKVDGLGVIFPKNRSKSENFKEALNRGLKKLKEKGLFPKYIEESEINLYEKWTCEWMKDHWSLDFKNFDN
ncbi:substrate-binding periplasmic protein [Pseudobacteriovorax antillogorgiicola]|uniref:Amino acid ABC transporter substrate-binding protein, PAAT family n=1 Tax=Pseudobacteriovorax antillogorgiicola TaxID=1513793 RepID=A0A1Y6CFT9_9BACT|nr:transporter substrate-binding domain-containing protein [Pseudobacteriovorax antillogorgiicola]TCS47691.1 amino acid ABC transporter substrate-binding protein (PAAT family) [Pseudobacteriovorax antillogorgiicola]SMF59500.1 amino acid ABC transporter substrate-binding protein, PAAT family [Pseudobacteriovorax antillogorgiicola]